MYVCMLTLELLFFINVGFKGTVYIKVDVCLMWFLFILTHVVFEWNVVRCDSIHG